MRPSRQLAQSHGLRCAADPVLAGAGNQRDIAQPLKAPGRALVHIRKLLTTKSDLVKAVLQTYQVLTVDLVKAVLQTFQVLMVDLGTAVSRNLLPMEDLEKIFCRILELEDLARKV